MNPAKNPFCQKWSSRDFRPLERFDAWQAALNQSHLGWTLQKNQKSGFSAEIQMSKLSDLQVVRCLCQPCSGYRGKQEIATDEDAYYGLLLMHTGHEEVMIGPRSAHLKPGNILLWDSTEPIFFKLHSPVYKTTVLIPQNKMNRILPQIRRLVGKVIDWRQGMGAVATSHISTLCTQASFIKPFQSYPAAEHALELIATSLGRQEAVAGETSRIQLLERMKNYIEGNLDDFMLGPQKLADQFGISIRYLHLLFEKEDQTVSQWIQGRRLEKCRRDLVVSGPSKNITETAFTWGFNDAAHFSRVFKKQFGVSPRDYRKSKT